MRSSALSLALGYVALGIAALVLFAAPLWYAWQVTIQDGRAEFLQSDAQRLTDVFRRDGADGLKTFIDARVQHADRRRALLLLTDASMHPLAGNLRGWPASVPPAPGNYTIEFDVGEQGVQTALVHVGRWRRATTCWSAATMRCLHRLQTALLVRPGRRGRRSVHRRLADRPHHPPRADVADPQHPSDRIGNHARRFEAPAAHPAQ